jgi:hypothetical protein
VGGGGGALGEGTGGAGVGLVKLPRYASMLGLLCPSTCTAIDAGGTSARLMLDPVCPMQSVSQSVPCSHQRGACVLGSRHRLGSSR